MLARLPKTTHVISRAPSIAVSATVAMATIMVAAAAYWLWFGLTQRSIGMDEGISILAAESILEHGYPRLPSEFVYNRAYLPHYLLAGSIGGLGLNDFAVMLPALLMALGSLYLVFLFAKDVFGRPWVGVAAAALLVLLGMQTFYATSPRMYMPLQFFTVLAAYSTWRGYIGGETKFQWAAILAAGAAILSHQQGAALVVVLPVSVLMVWWMRGSGRPAINRQLAVAGLIFLAGLAYATVLYKPPQGLQQIVSWNGRPVDLSGLNVDVSRWLDHLRQLDHDVAFSRLLAPVVVVVGARALWKRKNPVNQGVVFTLVFFPCASIGYLHEHQARREPILGRTSANLCAPAQHELRHRDRVAAERQRAPPIFEAWAVGSRARVGCLGDRRLPCLRYRHAGSFRIRHPFQRGLRHRLSQKSHLWLIAQVALHRAWAAHRGGRHRRLL